MKEHLEGRFWRDRLRVRTNGDGTARPGALRAALERIRAGAGDAVRQEPQPPHSYRRADRAQLRLSAGDPWRRAACARLVAKGCTFTSIICARPECSFCGPCLPDRRRRDGGERPHLAQDSIADRRRDNT